MSNLAKLRALVVDDEPESCRLLEKFFKKEGFNPTSAQDGFEALKIFEKARPDLIVLDVRMPRMDGIETLRRVRKQDGDCIVIMLSAVDAMDTALSAVREGANDFLRKPVVLQELKHSVERSLEHRRLLMENREYQENLESRVAEQTAALRTMYLDLKNTNIQIVRALAQAIEAKDPYTKGHCTRVTAFSLNMGKRLGLTQSQLESLEYGALLHDIGKIGIRGAVLNKKGKLTDEEYEHVKTHPVIGMNIISDIEFLRDMQGVVRHHHERHDGKGYPDRLKDTELDMLAKIVIVADAFDAMTSDRPYRTAMPLKRALDILKSNRGAQFDPAVVDMFIDNQLYNTRDNGMNKTLHR